MDRLMANVVVVVVVVVAAAWVNKKGKEPGDDS
jgi:hypothetical protein